MYVFSIQHVFSLLIICFFGAGALAAPSDSYIKDYLDKLYKNPKKTLNTIPEKKALWGTENNLRFSVTDILTNKFVERKDRARVAFYSQDEHGMKSAAKREPLDHFFGQERFEKNIMKIHKMGLTVSHVERQPWSDSYWPIYQGGIGMRYADDNLELSEDWKEHYEDREWPPQPMTPTDISQLSPAEKYDYVLGDPKYNLTSYMWDLGEAYYEKEGTVETWMGFCHGWAAASICEYRPEKMIEIHAPNGKKVPFYPADIKALATVLWSNARFPSKFIGGRCNLKNPEKDDNGRIVDEQCFDVNPGNWHIALTNQIGIAKQSMVLDATFDYEVWNQPILSYSYTYFNPVTKASFDNPVDATADIRTYERDLFKKYRNKNSKKVVGIALELTYVVETEPTAAESDSKSNDQLQTVTYLYDLELDEENNIVGGEWYHNLHPDFLWAPVKGYPAQAPGEEYLKGVWDIENSPIPEQWRKIGPAVAEYGMPMGTIVRQLIDQARKPQQQ